MADDATTYTKAFHGESTNAIVEAIGSDAALTLFRHFGGQHVYVPMNVREDHPWIDAIGSDAFKKLVETFGGERLDLPRAHSVEHKKSAIMRELDAGEQNLNKIARRVRSTSRYVRMVARDIGFLPPADTGTKKRAIFEALQRGETDPTRLSELAGCSPSYASTVKRDWKAGNPR